VRAYFGSKEAYPFDWWLTPIDGLTRYLSDPDPDRVYGPGALEELVVDGHVANVVATEFGFRLYHDFPRWDVGLPPRTVVTPGWQAHVPEMRARHARRLDRLLALDRPGRRLLFVRDRLDFDESRTETKEEPVEKLWTTLSKRWSHAEIELLLVNVPRNVRIPESRVRYVDFEDIRGEGPHGWQGDSSRWAQAFANAGCAVREALVFVAMPSKPPLTGELQCSDPRHT
jgi:hypothetical protein